jgi:hypothetical protein
MGLLASWLSQVPKPISPGHVIDIFARSYGGWYEGFSFSNERAAAASYYQTRFPSFFSVGNQYYRAHLIYADSLTDAVTPLGGSGHCFTHTAALRSAEISSSLKAASAPCSEAGCRLSEVRRWISRKKACLVQGCPFSYSDQFERKEQKQVDVHLALDFVTLCTASSAPVGLVSADNDFIPALVSITMRAHFPHITWIRPGSQGAYIDGFLQAHSINIINL